MKQFSINPTRTHGRFDCASDLAAVIDGLQIFYPNIQAWFASKVIPGLADGSRAIFERRGSSLDGFVIAKRTHHERKICTLWVAPSARRQGLASDLLAEASEWLGTSFPLITVCEEKLPLLQGLFSAHGYICTGHHDGLYRSNRREFVFNGMSQVPHTVESGPDKRRLNSLAPGASARKKHEASAIRPGKDNVVGPAVRSAYAALLCSQSQDDPDIARIVHRNRVKHYKVL